MLVRYKVENFLSFSEEREFSMIAGKARSHEKHVYSTKKIDILKSSYLYGANASGKSNFIKSIDFAKECILRGLHKVNTLEKHYKLNKNSLKKPSQFEFEILIDDKIYAYGFSIMLETKRVIEEWLYEVEDKQDRVIFLRQTDQKIVESLSLTDSDKVKLDVYLDDLEPTNLLLEILNKKKWEKDDYDFRKVLNWFDSNLEIIFPSTYDGIIEYFKEPKKLLNYLRNFDIGITGIKLGDREFKEIPIPDGMKEDISNEMSKMVSEQHDNSVNQPTTVINMNGYFLNLYLKDNQLQAKEILFKHEGLEEETEFKLYEESDGTKRLLELLPLLEKVKNKHCTVLIDELERSLHPVLVIEFLDQLYKNMECSNSQVIIATHESRLLDLNKIRRDEVWFVEKDVKEGSRLYSLEEYKTRFDTKLDKAYLLGRFGGIPNIKRLFEDEIECDD